MTKPNKRVKRRTKYAEEFKRKIAKEYLAGKASYAILAEDYDLANKGVVREFVRWYKRRENSGVLNTLKEIQVNESGKNQEENSGDLMNQSEVEKLQKQLRLEQLKVELLETMIDHAEKELLIDIRKKSGTNQ